MALGPPPQGFFRRRVVRGKAAETRSFRLAGATEEDKRFEAETIERTGQEAGHETGAGTAFHKHRQIFTLHEFARAHNRFTLRGARVSPGFRSPPPLDSLSKSRRVFHEEIWKSSTRSVDGYRCLRLSGGTGYEHAGDERAAQGVANLNGNI